ncbi:MAG TPA: riboflavin kinase, partial [Gaiellaceae bacterium]
EVPLVPGISSTRIRQHAHAGEMEAAAQLLGRPFEVDGVVVPGDQRGGTLGFPTANLRVDPALLVPAFGIYAGAVGERRAAISIGVNPHYGGTERRIEAYLLDWEGDLYGDRLVVELWKRLRQERAFESEADLVAQIARDVDETRAAVRPV